MDEVKDIVLVSFNELTLTGVTYEPYVGDETRFFGIDEIRLVDNVPVKGVR
jgi:hypothetical protein